MDAEIIAIGTELVLGVTVDTNSAWLARELAPLGVLVRRVTVVDDEQAAIVEAIRGALSRAELVITTGGLGPTADDRTRAAAAEACGRQLEFHPELLEQIEARFQAFGRPMSESNRQQAYIPSGSRAIPNPHGTAPAFLIEQGAHVLIAFPGVPAELHYLAQHALLPYLRDERGLRSYLAISTLRISGLNESLAGELIADLMAGQNPRVGITAKGGEHEVRIAAYGDDQEHAQTLLLPLETELRQRLSPYLLEQGRIATHTVDLLIRCKANLALYEGLRPAPVYQALSATPAGVDHLATVMIHPEPTTFTGAIALAALHVTASALLRQSSAVIVLALQAGLPDDDGFSELSLVLIGPWGDRTLQRRLDLALSDGWQIAGNSGLELLRRALEEYVVEVEQVAAAATPTLEEHLVGGQASASAMPAAGEPS